MGLCRDPFPVLSLIFVISFTSCLQSIVGMNYSNINGLSQSTPSEKECLALLQLAGQYNFSTNCNCTVQGSRARLSISPCNGNCSAALVRGRRHFAGCTGQSVRELHLSKIGLQGNLSWLANFKHLKLLDLSFNNLSDSLPSSILWKLGEVTHVNLSFNSFNGNLSNLNPPNLSTYNPHLKTLDFSHNQILGPLPQHLCTIFPNLTQLRVTHNHLTGYANLSLCKRLESLDASFNRLQGPFLEDLASVKTMKYIDLHGNHLINGSIPHLSSFSQLTYFDVSFNNLSGTFGFHSDDVLPSNLSRIDVSHNNLQVGLCASTIRSTGLSSFWPNKACKACFLEMSTPSPSPAPSPPSSHSASKLVHKKRVVSKTTRLYTVVGITTGSVGAVLLIAVASCILWTRLHRQRPRWPHKQLAAVPFKHVPEIGPFSFESQAGAWIADVKDPSNVPIVIFTKPLLNLTFVDLLQATKSFNREFEAGDGSGLVYECVLPRVLEDNVKVAVQVVENGRSLSNEAARIAFTAMGELKHDNLVPLLGYCIVGEEKLLIYKHVEGGSLEDALHAVVEGVRPMALMDGATEMEDWSNMESWPEDDFQSCGINDTSKRPCLDWKTRHNVALGVARALAYLHNGCQQPIVHGAVSSACILMDVSMKEARLANYGGAWDLPRQFIPGYVAPECRQTAQMPAEGVSHMSLSLKCQESVQVVAALSPKCDVYSMGVVLLELATGRRAVGYYGGSTCGTLVAWVRRLMKGKRAQLERALDPGLLMMQVAASSSDHLQHEIPDQLQLIEMMKLGYLCTADSPSKRPSMQQVVGLLKDLGQ